jgi:glycosyltransferase involved in cell wall biosynthesis
MTEKYLVSVLMSTFNNQNTIGSAIESIINQTYQNIELLIMDDCSSDETYEIISNYSAKHKNIKIFQNNINVGLTRSLNILIEKANGEFIARQDADDISIRERIDNQVNYIISNKLDFCTSRALNMESGKAFQRFTYYFPRKLIFKYKNPFIHGTLVIKKSVIDNIGGYDEQFYYAQDYKLFHDLIKSGYKFKNLKKILYHSNTRNNISSNKKDLQSYYAYCVKSNTVPDGRK